MKIVTLYKTSRGVWADIRQAEDKKNRAKITDINDPKYGQREYWTMIKAIEDDGEFYELTPMKVNATYTSGMGV